MRYSCTALVLATALITRVAAGPVRHAHARFHEKKDAELKVEADIEKKDVDWSKVDYSGVDWSKVDYTYSAGQTWGKATSAAAAVPAPTAAPAAAVITPAAAASSPSSGSSSGSTISVTSEVIASLDVTKIISLGFKSIGVNAQSESGGVWIGTDGPYTNEFINTSGEGVVLCIWGPTGSWVNALQPLITHSIPHGASVTISFASGQSGAWTAVYSDTELINGQVSNTWGEYTFSPEGVVDVSREVNMSGHSMEVVGPHCTTNMDTCVFKCSSGNSCEFGYELLNCTPGTQAGAQYGVYDGSPSGGCGWLGATTAALKTTFS